MNWNDPENLERMRAMIDRRREAFRQLPPGEMPAAARRLDIGCQFLLNINDMERGCMTDEEWVVAGLTDVRASYVGTVFLFLLTTGWPNQPTP